MSNHTPGPWTTDDNGEVDTSAADLTAWDGVLADGEVVAYCHPANASLITAAPDMLSALLACVEPTEPGEDCCLPPELYNQVCAAIAKAEGRS